jgi:hypothetical protein
MPITGSTAQQISHSEFGFTTLVALFISGFSTTEELLWLPAFSERNLYLE